MNNLNKYYSVRDQMGTFDRLEFHSNSLLGNAIRWKTKDWSNHTGAIIVFNEYNKIIFSMESLNDGPDPNRFSLRLEQYKGNVKWYPLKREYHGMRQSLGYNMLNFEGLDYDIHGLIENLWKRPILDQRKLYCSEYITLVGKITGLPYDINYLKGLTPRPGKDMDGLGWWEKGIDIL